MRRFRELPVLIVLAALAGCTGELPTLPDAAGPGASLVGSSATADTPAFNPFNERPETDIGRREVIVEEKPGNIGLITTRPPFAITSGAPTICSSV